MQAKRRVFVRIGGDIAPVATGTREEDVAVKALYWRIHQEYEFNFPISRTVTLPLAVVRPEYFLDLPVPVGDAMISPPSVPL